MKKLTFALICTFNMLLLAGCATLHSPILKYNFKDFDIHFENVELDNPQKSKLIKTTISGWILDSALSISSYKIRYKNDKVFIDIDRKIGSTGMAMDYYIQFLMSQNVKEIYIGNSLFWTRSAESYFKSENMNFPLNIVLPKEVSDVAQGPVERYLSEEKQADIKKFSQHIKKYAHI
mgnify:FL=1